LTAFAWREPSPGSSAERGLVGRATNVKQVRGLAGRRREPST
jgi:hypothetical protein